MSQYSAVPFGWRKVEFRDRHSRKVTSQRNPADQGPSEKMSGRGAGTHGDVLNLHTESVLSLHTAVPRRVIT